MSILRPLFPPTPEGLPQTDPRIQAWRTDRLEQEVSSIDGRLRSVEGRSSFPRIDWMRAAIVVGLILMGALGRLSPEQVKSGLRLLGSL